MDLQRLVDSIPGFAAWSHADRIRLFAWFLHTYRPKPYFHEADIRTLYDDLNLGRPSNITSYLKSMVNSQAREMLRSKEGYRLGKEVRDAFDAKYGQRQRTVQVTTLLSDLQTRVPDLAGREYLDEALVCFQNGAFRAAIVMTWNLGYDHLCQYILKRKLREFNSQLPKSFPRADILAVGKRDDFSELKESQVLQVCRSANITSSGVHKLLKEKLDRRNVAAHPSGVIVAAPTAEEFIIDLVTNVVLNANLT